MNRRPPGRSRSEHHGVQIRHVLQRAAKDYGVERDALRYFRQAGIEPQSGMRPGTCGASGRIDFDAVQLELARKLREKIAGARADVEHTRVVRAEETARERAVDCVHLQSLGA
jgi:hypothetical protein